MKQVNTNQILEALETSVQSTVESMFFMEAEAVTSEEAARLDGVEGLEVHVAIAGALSGELTIQMSVETAFRLAQATPVLMDAKIDKEMVHDLLAEISNTICGRISAALSEGGPAFDLSIPEIRSLRLVRIFNATCERSYSVDHGLVRCTFISGKEAPHADRKAV